MAVARGKGCSSADGVLFSIPLTNSDLAIGAIHDFGEFIKAAGHGLNSIQLQSGENGQPGAVYTGYVQTGNGGLCCGNPGEGGSLTYTITKVENSSISWTTSLSANLGTQFNDVFTTTASVVATADGRTFLSIDQNGSSTNMAGYCLTATISFCILGICCPCGCAVGVMLMSSSQNADHRQRLMRIQQYLATYSPGSPQVPTAMPAMKDDEEDGEIQAF